MSLPISNWIKLADAKMLSLIKKLRIFEVKEPDMGDINLRDIIYYLEAGRVEIYRLVEEIKKRDEKIKELENK